MLLKQDFWSIRDQSTYFALGRDERKLNMLRTKAIPVATGIIKHSILCWIPKIKILETELIYSINFEEKRKECF